MTTNNTNKKSVLVFPLLIIKIYTPYRGRGGGDLKKQSKKQLLIFIKCYIGYSQSISLIKNDFGLF